MLAPCHGAATTSLSACKLSTCGSAMDTPFADTQFKSSRDGDAPSVSLPSSMRLHMKRKYAVISQSDPLTGPRPPPMVVEEDDDDDERPLPPLENEDYDDLLVAQSPNWFMKLVLLQADLIYNCIALLLSPISSLFFLASDSYHRAEETKERVESAVQKAPASITQGSVLLISKLGMGFLGAAYVGMVLMVVMVASVVVGVGLVRIWVDEPVVVRERLQFDYADIHPKAVFSMFSGLDRRSSWVMLRKTSHVGGIPVGHTFQVSVLLLMPDSDYNRLVGVFQLTAELLTDTGQVIAKSSQPCMLRFRSLPVRLARVFLLGVPILLGLSTETQMVRVDFLKYKETSVPRTDAIRVTLIPRAGTLSPPQLYEAEILINSQLPWPKKLVHNWKWTFYVWVSLYTYTMLLLVLLCCCKPLILSGPMGSSRDRQVEEEGPTSTDEVKERWRTGGTDDDRDRDISELLRELRESRRRRRALLMAAEAAGSSASSMSVTREREETTTATSGPHEDGETGDSASVC